MPRVKLHYNRYKGQMELRNEGSSAPIAFMNEEEFAHLMQQIFDFTERFNPQMKVEHEGRISQGFHNAMRREAWNWIGGAVKDKVTGFFKRKSKKEEVAEKK